MHDANLVHGSIKGVGILIAAQPNVSDTKLEQYLDLK